MERFKVITTEGWPIGNRMGATSSGPGLTASVLDTHDCHREVARFRTENVHPPYMKREHRAEHVVYQANAKADELNAWAEDADAAAALV